MTTRMTTTDNTDATDVNICTIIRAIRVIRGSSSCASPNGGVAEKIATVDATNTYDEKPTKPPGKKETLAAQRLRPVSTPAADRPRGPIRRPAKKWKSNYNKDLRRGFHFVTGPRKVGKKTHPGVKADPNLLMPQRLTTEPPAARNRPHNAKQGARGAWFKKGTVPPRQRPAFRVPARISEGDSPLFAPGPTWPSRRHATQWCERACDENRAAAGTGCVSLRRNRAEST